MGGGDENNVSINVLDCFKSIFMHADVLDCFLMAFGLIGAIGVGAIFGPSKNNFVHNINEVLSLPLPPFSLNKISNVRLL